MNKIGKMSDIYNKFKETSILEADAIAGIFNDVMKAFQIKDLSNLSDDDRKKFYDEIHKGLTAKKKEAELPNKIEGQIDPKVVNTEADKKITNAADQKVPDPIDVVKETPATATDQIKIDPVVVNTEADKKITNAADQKVPDAIEKDQLKEAVINEEEYKDFFKSKLKKYNVNSPMQLDPEKKKKFWDEIKSEWKGDSKVKEDFDAKIIEACKGKKDKVFDSNQVDKFLTKYTHLNEKIFAKLNTESDIHMIYEKAYSMLPDWESKDALTFYKQHRLEELNDEYSKKK